MYLSAIPVEIKKEAIVHSNYLLYRIKISPRERVFRWLDSQLTKQKLPLRMVLKNLGISNEFTFKSSENDKLRKRLAYLGMRRSFLLLSIYHACLSQYHGRRLDGCLSY